MTAVLIAAALLVIPSIMPLVALTGMRAELLALAPLFGAVVAGFAGTLTLIVAGGPLLWYALLAALANASAAGFMLLRARRSTGRGGLSPRRAVVPAAVTLIMVAAATIPLIGPLQATNLAIDGRSIWMLHARWMSAGHDYVRFAVANPVFNFSHADYPPLVPASVGTVWQVVGGVDLRGGQLIVAMLNIAVCAALGLAVAGSLRARNRNAGVVAGALVAAATVGVAGADAMDGYADVIAAGGVAAAAVFGLLQPRSRPALVMCTICAAAAALTKNEGLVGASVVLVLVMLRHTWPVWRLPRRLLLRLAAGGALGALLLVAWPLAVRVAGAQSDVENGSHIIQLLTLSPSILARVQPTVSYLWNFWQVAPWVAAAAIAGTLVLRRNRRDAGIGEAWWLWLVMIITAALLVATYAAGPYDVFWWLTTSASRTTMLVRILLLCDVAIWGGLASAVAVDALHRAFQSHQEVGVSWSNPLQ